MTSAVVTDAKVTPVDRLGFTLFVAVAVHAILLLGIGFTEEKAPALAHTLEVTLAQFESEKAPEKADFIAQKNQVGSGEADKKARPTTTERALFQTNESKQLAAQSQPLPIPVSKPEPAPVPEVETPTPKPTPLPKKTVAT
ncbi:MAG: energy transducer TonB, partial [Motiliproteus sp.]|nr:energy transducer TonB [Motiliproteus sp.]